MVLFSCTVADSEIYTSECNTFFYLKAITIFPCTDTFVRRYFFDVCSKVFFFHQKRNENKRPIKHTHHENEFGLTLKPTYEKES